MARFLSSSRALFQHIPRTGGTWVEQAIDYLGIHRSRWICKQPRRLPRKHALLRHYYPNEAAKVNYVFTFVRHPVSYYESNWRWLNGFRKNKRSIQRIANPKRSGQQWDWHPQRIPAKHFHPDFNVWMQRILDNEPAWCTRLFEWYCGPEGGEYCNYIGRQESLVHDFIEVIASYLNYDLTDEQIAGLHELNEKNSSCLFLVLRC